jgi:hypothetical protein
LKTKHKWREEWDSETMTEKDDEREQEAEEEGDDKERKGEKIDENKKKAGDKCGCCCHDGEQKKTKMERAKAGEPDDEDDVIEIHPKPPKVPVVIGGGNKPIRPVTPPPKKKPDPKPPIKKPEPPPKPPKEPKEPGKGELNSEFGFYVERPFYIVSQCGEKRYLDVLGNNIVVKTPNEFDSQVWFFDQRTKTIKSSLNKNKSLDIQNSGQTRNLQLWNTNGGWFQRFKFSQNYLKNVQDGRVIEIAGGQDSEGQNVGVGKLTYQLCQKWSIDYVDEAEDRKTTGLYVPYQIYLGRAFIIRSRMPMQRVLTVVGNRNLVIRTHNRQDNNQIFFLDPATKTIKSVA